MTRNAWGGARAGAGRRARGPVASEPHKTRHSFRHAQVRVVARVIDGVSLRQGAARAAVATALEKAAHRHDFTILSAVIRSSRIELVIAADHHVALARGMQGLQVSAAKRINGSVGRSGVVFPDRYRIVGRDRGRDRATRRARPEPEVASKGPFAGMPNAPVLISPRWVRRGKDPQRGVGRTLLTGVLNPRRWWWL